jgi:3-oxoacyl-[acyl-carrier-protein] synthase-3
MLNTRAVIDSIAVYLPSQVVTNENLAEENPDWDMNLLYDKTGVRSRHIVGPDETASDLAVKAAESLFSQTTVPREEIDLLLFCTQCPDYLLPQTSSLLQHRIGLSKEISTFDLNLGCTGFVGGLAVAKAFLESRMARCALLLTADTYSKLIHPRDRTVRALFGDGAAATLIRGVDGCRAGLEEFAAGTDGARAACLIVRAGGARLPRSAETAREEIDDSGCVRTAENLAMNGPEIFTFVMSTVPRVVHALLKRANLGPGDIDFYVMHQASLILMNSLRKQMRVPPEKVPIYIEDVGNTVSATIPMTLRKLLDEGKLKPGMRLMLVGFGVGLSWAGCTLTWGMDPINPRGDTAHNSCVQR